MVVVALAGAPSRAVEHCSGEASRQQDGGEATAECVAEDGGAPGDSHGTWDRYCAPHVGAWQAGDEVTVHFVSILEGIDRAEHAVDPTGEYAWYDYVCWRDGEWGYTANVIVTVTAPVPPEEIRDAAAARLIVPAPKPETSPPLSRQAFVGIPTWLWMDPSDWVPMEETETRGITTVRVRAAPTEARWVMGGDGDGVCYGPGVAWQSGMAEDDTDCAYTFAHSSYGEPDGRFDAAVTVTWAFEWWINGTYQGVFTTVDRSTQFTVAVGEIQIVETGG